MNKVVKYNLEDYATLVSGVSAAVLWLCSPYFSMVFEQALVRDNGITAG